MKKLYFLLFSLLVFSLSNAQIVNIPDPNFKNALLNHQPIIDTNGDGEIQVSEAESINALFVDDQDINDVTGIEAFVNIIYLNCSDNNIINLDISQLSNLVDLYAERNEITSIDASNNPDLYLLRINENPLLFVDVSQNVNLELLSVVSPVLTNIDVTNNINLISLVCGGTFSGEIISPLNNLDLSTSLNLQQLLIYGTQISNLDLSNNINLNHLRLRYNEYINDLDISSNLLLERIMIVGTQILSLDISNNPEILQITIGDSPISTIDFSAQTNLMEVLIDETLFQSIDLSQNPICNFRAQNNFELEFVNLKNGYNTSFDPIVGCITNPPYSGFSVTNNPNLDFICVDDVAFALEFMSDKPPHTSFVEDCAIANGDLNTIEGTVRYDLNENGCGNGAIALEGFLVNINDGEHQFANTTQGNGFYTISVGENTYNTTVVGIPPYFTLVPNEYVHTFVGFNQTEIADFCIQPAVTANDLVVSLAPINAAQPGFEATYQLIYENVGTTTLSGNVVLEFDNTRISFNSSTPAQTNQTGNTVNWDFTDLNPFSNGIIDLVFDVEQPPTNQSGDILQFTATVNPTDEDETPENNIFLMNQTVVNSFDPNDKLVVQGSQVLIENADKYLNYRVRFQNTGTANAINVRIQDQLDPLLDWTTLLILSSSHPMEVNMVDGLVDFIFDDINLPPESSDPQGSQGYVTFKVKPVLGIELGDTINNTSDIFFDYNPAIETNTVSTTFVDELSTPEFEENLIVLFPNPTFGLFNILSDVRIIEAVEVFSLVGQRIESVQFNSKKVTLNMTNYQNGCYFVKVSTANETMVFRLIKK